jgi:hypothetical protein
MKTISALIVCLFLGAVTCMAQTQSLADLAKKEKERREALKATTKVITNQAAAKYQTAPVTTGGATAATPDKPGSEAAAATDKPATEGQPKTEGTTAADKPATDEPVDLFGRPESFWRKAFADARQKVQELENQANVLVLKLNDLQNRFYRENDGFKQQEIQREIQKTFYEQDLNKTNLEKAKSDLTDLEREARKSGALPGWIR